MLQLLEVGYGEDRVRSIIGYIHAGLSFIVPSCHIIRSDIMQGCRNEWQGPWQVSESIQIRVVRIYTLRGSEEKTLDMVLGTGTTLSKHNNTPEYSTIIIMLPQ